jgi:NADPH:quinone reductase-like Zn-dependent oxidoreductase
MRAVLYDRWGGPEVLRVADVPAPVAGEGEVLVRVAASSINSWDWDLVTGKPYLMRPEGFAKGPKQIGFDVAGIVEAVGPGVTRFTIGDAVFGDQAFTWPSAFADLATIKESALAMKPAGLSFIDTAALPQAGLLAMLGLEGKPAIRSGSRVLINGAGGGVGPIAIQLAKLAGAEVTGVDSAGKLEAMLAAGADRAFDYAATDFTAMGERYDRILDVMANRPLGHFARALRRGGRFAMVGGTPGTLLTIAALGPLLGLATGKHMGLVLHKVRAGELERLGQLAANGKVRALIDSTFPMERVQEAFARFATGKAIGKVMVTIDESLAG